MSVTALNLNPDLMTAAERLDEVARLLAAGILRARARRQGSQAPSKGNNGESSLDTTTKESGHVRTENRRGERR